MTNGTIGTCNVKAFHGRFSDHAIATLGYSYKVNGDYYSGYYIYQCFDEQAAWSFADARKDKSVLVRYMENHPDKSMIREQDQPGGL